MLNSVPGVTLQGLAHALGGEVSGHQVLAPGPGHSAMDRSLSVKMDGDKLIVHSHSGDDFATCLDHVRKHAGLPEFKPNGNGHEKPIASRSPPPPSKPPPPPAASSDEPKKIVARYPYTDAKGALLYEVLRYEPKSFRQRAADGSWKLDGVPRVLYKLPELIADSAAYIFICEGERDADRVATLGLCSTTISGGTKWTDDLIAPLRGRDVIILPDVDEAGAKKALEAANALHGVAASTRVVKLPGLGGPKYKDVSDWLNYDPKRSEILATHCLAQPLWVPGSAEVEALEPDGDKGLGEWDAGDDHAPISPRGWLLGNSFCRRFVSSLIGDGGVGKTALRYTQLLSLATGQTLTGEHVFQRCRVLIISLEDGADELRRRFRAACLHHEIDPGKLKDWLFLAAPASGKLMVLDQRGRPVVSDLAVKLEQAIVSRRIDIISLDPFVKTHSVEENSNSAIDDVVQVLTNLAERFDLAVDVPHHMAKGVADPGNANRARGASAAKDAFRLVYTLSPMTTEEAQAFGLEELERRHLVRMDSAKVNIAPPTAEATWFRLVGVRLDNGTELYPNGDTVQTVERWTPPDVWRSLSGLLLNQILNTISAGMPDGNRYTDAPKATDRAAWRVVVEHAPDKSEAAARQIIKAWMKSGLLTRQDYENPATRKTVKGLFVDDARRPS